MSKLYMTIVVLFFVAQSVAFGATASGNNPHKEPAVCAACHVASAKDLGSTDVSLSKKRQLQGGPVRVCTQCHAVSLGHGIGKKPEMNSLQLPVGSDGTITCATTCHDIHLAKPETAAQKRFYLRAPHRKLCVSCHRE